MGQHSRGRPRSLLSICLCVRNTTESCEEPLCHGVDGIDGGLRGQLWPTRGDVEKQEVLDRGEFGSFDSGSKAVLPG